METTIREFQEEVRDILNGNSWFSAHGIDWLAENTLDVEYEIKKHLGQTGMVAVVTTPELNYQGEAKKYESRQNFEEHKVTSVTFDLISNNDPSDVRTVTLDTDPSTQMFEGGTIHFSKWLDGEPIDLVYNIPFPNLFGAVKDNVAQGLIPPSEGTMWHAFTGLNDEYHTNDNPFSFGTYWTIPDEQGRTITVTDNETSYSVSGGCFGDFTVTGVEAGVEKTVISGSTEYKVLLTFLEGANIPDTVSLSMKTGTIVGKPFDKKLKWIQTDENAWFTTDYVPDVNDRIALKVSTVGQTRLLNVAYGTSMTEADMFTIYGLDSNPTFYIRRGTNVYATLSTIVRYEPPYTTAGAGTTVIPSTTIFTQQLQNASQSLTGSRTFVWAAVGCYDDVDPLLQPPMVGYNRGNTTGNPNYVPNRKLTVLGPTVAHASVQAWTGKFHWLTFGAPKATTIKFAAFPVIKDNKVCLWDSVSNKVYQNGYTGDTSGITWEEDTAYNALVTDSSEATFTETVTKVNKGFDATISLQIVENPTVNRGKPDKDAIATALEVAHNAVYTLSGYDSGHFNDFSPSTIKQSTVAGAGGKLLQVDCRFTATPVL